MNNVYFDLVCILAHLFPASFTKNVTGKETCKMSWPLWPLFTHSEQKGKLVHGRCLLKFSLQAC